MKILSLLSLSALLILLSGFDACHSEPAGRVVELTILHTNDIHSHLRAEPSPSEKNPYNLGGLARLKTLVDQIRASRSNTLLLDAGDWSEAGMAYVVDAGVAMLRIFDAIGYDAAVVGNHDFINGPSQLASTIERAHPRFPLLGANKNLDAVPDKDRLAKLMRDYVVLKAGPVRVAVVGLLTDDIVYFPFFKPGIITSPTKTASAITQEIHDKGLADVIVLLSHNSLSKQSGYAKTVPWVNAVISGHSHDKTSKPVVVQNAGRPVYIVEAKEWGQFLGELRLSYDTQTKQVVQAAYQIHPVDASLNEHPTVAKLVDDTEKAILAKYGRDVLHDHVGDGGEEMPHETGHEGLVGNLVVDAYREAASTNLAVESHRLIESEIYEGALTTNSLFEIVPHIYHPLALDDPSKPFPEFGRSWTLKRLGLKGRDLRAILNILTFIQTGSELLGWVSLSGVRATWSHSGGLSPLQTIAIYDQNAKDYLPLKDDATYTVALGDGLMLGIREIVSRFGMNIDLSNVEETGIETWQALSALVQKLGTVRAAEYEPGVRMRTVEADLAVHEHGIKVNGNSINVEVRNEGGQASTVGGQILRITRGEADDAVNDATPNNETIPVAGDIELPALSPGEHRVVEVPWDKSTAPGYYAIRAALVGGDANKFNDSVVVHRRLAK